MQQLLLGRVCCASLQGFSSTQSFWNHGDHEVR